MMAPAEAAPSITTGRRVRWILLAAIPSGLLSATTNLITTVGTEVMFTTDPPAAVTDIGVEVMYMTESDLRITNVGVEVMYLEEPRPVQFRVQIIG